MLGQELRVIRERRGLTVRTAAGLASISAEALSALERGDRYPSLRTLESLAEVLRIRIVIGPDETVVEADT
jgi:transcriptional regulator with XRE-family HTH domain